MLAKIFFLLCLVSNIAVLSAYNDDILTIYSKMLPRFVLMSSQQEKVKSEIKICVLHDKVDTKDALLLIDKVNFNYPNGIKNNRIKLIDNDYDSLGTCKDTQVAFLFYSNEQNIKKALLFLNEQNILSISYNPELLEKGAQISLYIGRKVQPYLNLQEITKHNIKLNRILLRVSKIYTKSDK